MNLLYQQQQQKHFFCLLFIFITQIKSIPIKENLPHIRCNILQQNCTLIPHNVSLNQNLIQRKNQSLPLTTPKFRSTTRINSLEDFDEFSENLKRAALILAGVALGLGILRICLMLCKSRSRNNSFSNRHSATVRPQVSTVEHHNQFKPDLPPAYAEAIATVENDGGKLPEYEELPYEQQQYVYNNNGYITTQM